MGPSAVNGQTPVPPTIPDGYVVTSAVNSQTSVPLTILNSCRSALPLVPHCGLKKFTTFSSNSIRTLLDAYIL